MLHLPSGAGAPARDAAQALAAALDPCQSIRTQTAEIAVSGASGGHRLHAHLLAGTEAPASIRLEAAAPFGQPLFVFVATGDAATLYLPHDQRVVRDETTEAVLEALAGVPLRAAELRALIAGCASTVPDAAGARAFGDNWRVVPAADGEELYLHREDDSASWRLVALFIRGTRVEFRSFDRDGPHLIRLRSLGSPAFDLQLALSQVDINPPLGPAAFQVTIPRSAAPISLDDLRRSGPFSRR